MHLETASKMIANASSVAILTGAGVSTASGIPDFRSTNGLWTADKAREYYISNHYFYKDPVDFWQKYKDIFRVKLLKDYGPNHVHRYLRDLEVNGKQITVITQNVDGLHTLAGNEHVIEYHGTLNRATCPNCGSSYDLPYLLAAETPVCEKCAHVLKPDVVLFGDPITEHDKAEYAIQQSELVLVLGTSLLVSPFNILPEYSKSLGKPSILINREPTVMDDLFDLVIHDDLSKIVQQLQK
ncbi:NAD-dependent protein deacylase [Terribacillus saccharophilus]|uniref:NAD-dependent protein deacylase n=1 Tax=Terribacillus saccharophilus TaxID=361277 RepID=UPI000BA5EEEC|nr:NAD-dependent protein deacylase [Terribacillus saccharophilus]PAF39041.1 NAD-dependent protein deacylase [Terribacillus saccharophilus]